MQAYSPIFSPSGSICWQHIVHLNNVQKKSGLHAANRITDKHVKFDNQKMKVWLIYIERATLKIGTWAVFLYSVDVYLSLCSYFLLN